MAALLGNKKITLGPKFADLHRQDLRHRLGLTEPHQRPMLVATAYSFNVSAVSETSVEIVSAQL